MNKNIIIAAFTFASVILFTACEKEKVNNPLPVEEELITTLVLNISDSATGSQQSFAYKVDNGFGTDPMIFTVDTIKLAPEKSYKVTVSLLNEHIIPSEEVTQEIIDENTEHIFMYTSNPKSGAGSITASNGNKDDNGKPFNQVVTFTTGAAGDGFLAATLIHQPTQKESPAVTNVGGETDAEAIFPVLIQ
jgi:hypothetical protein